MPLQSKSQMRWMFANHPEMARRWAEETPDMKSLPEQKGSAPIKRAMKRMMRDNKPNSGTRPPELTTTEDTHRNCGTCRHFNGAGKCRLYSYKVQPNEVCSSWSPKPS